MRAGALRVSFLEKLNGDSARAGGCVRGCEYPRNSSCAQLHSPAKAANLHPLHVAYHFFTLNVYCCKTCTLTEIVPMRRQSSHDNIGDSGPYEWSYKS